MAEISDELFEEENPEADFRDRVRTVKRLKDSIDRQTLETAYGVEETKIAFGEK